MLQGKCLLCFTVNRQTFDIFNTHLQQVLEKIIDSKIEAESLCLCFICHKRMQQCYQLMQLAKTSQYYLNNVLTEKIDVNLKKHQSLLELTTSKMVNISFSNFKSHIETDVKVKKECLNVDEMEQQENLECTQAVTDDQLKDISSEHDDIKDCPIWIKTEDGVSIEDGDSFISLQNLKTSVVKKPPADILKPSNLKSTCKRFKLTSHYSTENKISVVSSPENANQNFRITESLKNEDIALTLINSSTPPSSLSGHSTALSELGSQWPDVSIGIGESSKDLVISQASKNCDENIMYMYVCDNNNGISIITDSPDNNNLSTINNCADNSSYLSTVNAQQNDDKLLIITATGSTEKNDDNLFLSSPATRSTKQNDDGSYNAEDTSNTFNLMCDKITTSKPPLVLKSGGIDQTKLQVSLSGKRSEKSKLYFCIFCKELKTKFANHLIIKHSNESEVRDFMYLQKKSKSRAKLIADIRNRGTFLHNTNPDYNKGQLIVARRLHKNSINTAEDFLACSNCGNSYSKLSIRFHFARCNPNKKSKERNVLKSGRALANNIHPVACKLLRQKIFPVLRVQDDEVKCIRYDKLIIKYGNKLCNNYTLPHQYNMIRAKLRLLGKFKLEMLKLEKDTAIQLSDLFIPKLFYRAVNAFKVVAHWDPDLGCYKTPSTAHSLSALVKACCSMIISEFIKSKNYEKERQANRFLHLWKLEIPVTIHKKTLEHLTNLKRNIKVMLPSQEDIKKLNDYLKKECEICLKILNDEKQEFDRGAWLHLQECSLIYIQLFNRRPAGEIERITLDNYQNKKRVLDDVDKKLLRKFSKNIQEYAKQFIRITLRGKLSRTVSLLLTPFMTACIECILYFRQAAGVKAENNFIFAKPGDNYLGKEYVRACPLLEKFSVDCGALMPKTLRDSNLRKHVAMYVSLQNIEECQVDTLANILGHITDIHKNIYRIPIPISEIAEVFKLVTLAIGDELSEEEEDSKEEEDEEIEQPKKIVQKRRGRSKKGLKNRKCNKPEKRKITESSDHNEEHDNIKDDDNIDVYETDSGVKDDDDDNRSDDNDKLIQQINKSVKNKHTRHSTETIKRLRWSKEEKYAVIKYFGNLETLKKVPTLEQCKRLIITNPILQKRSAIVVKAWISNQRIAKNVK